MKPTHRKRRQSKAEHVQPALLASLLRPFGSRWISCYCLALLVIAAAVFTFHPISDPDCWFHLAFGRELLHEHRFLTHDLFSYTSNNGEWISSGWASSALLYAAFAAGGPA